MLLFSVYTFSAVAAFTATATLIILFFLGQHRSKTLRYFEVMHLYRSEAFSVEI